MPAKEQAHSRDKATARRRSAQPAIQEFDMLAQQTHPAAIVQRARHDPSSLAPRNVLQLQCAIGNQAVGRLLARTVQVQHDGGMGVESGGYKEYNIKDYEIKRWRYPDKEWQRQTSEEEEQVQTKPLTATITPLVQRQTPEEEKVQTKPLAASISPTGTLDVVQMAPLFAGSAIDYDAANNVLHYSEIPKNISAADHATLYNAITAMLALYADANSIEKQLRKYFVERQVLLDFSLVAKQWTQLANHLGVVATRRAADEAQLRQPAVGLLDAGDNFDAYELAGADPHKGGEATLMLRYTTAAGQTKRIVYKPADLTPELVLFAGGEFRVERFGGTYTTPGAGGVAGVYGYMTFLQEAGPQTPADVASIYNSLGEGLAVAYVYGLRDLHHENFILFRDHIQWIDLEAMTGTFTDYQSTDMLRLFPEVAKKMLATLRETTEPGQAQWLQALRRQVNRAALARRLGAVDVNGEIRAGFQAKLPTIPATAPQAAIWATRFVPFPTEDLYMLVNEWHDKADLDAMPFPPAAWAGVGEPDWYTNRLNALKANYTGAPAEVDAMMTAPNTRAAIRRGDIPFFIRRGNSICDEAGHVVVASSTHLRLQNQAAMTAGIQARLGGPAPASLDWVINMVQLQHNRLCNDLRQGL